LKNLYDMAGHSLSTFELTISRLASKVRQIVSDKIGSRDGIEDDENSGGSFDSSASSDFEASSTTSSGQEEEEGEEEKWRKRRRKKPREQRRRRRKHYPSSSEYESEESEGPDSVTSSSYSEDEKNYKRKCSPNWGTAAHPNNKASEEWLHLRKRPRAPRIGLLPRSEAFDEDDIRAVSAICDSNTSGTESTAAAAAAVGKVASKVNGSNHCDPDFTPKMTSEAAEAAGSTPGKPEKMISTSFVTVIEGTKDLTLHEEKQRSPQRPRPAAMATSEDELLVDTAEGPVPIPAKCSAQLRRLLQSHSITRPAVCNLNGGLGSSNENSATSIAEPRRPIYPNLPYSPYSSPVSSPRVRRKPLRETTRVNSTIQSDGEYVQLNQYKLEQAIGQGSYGIVKLAYNKDDDVQYAVKILSKKKLKRKGGIFGRKLPNRKAPGGAERKQSENPLQKVYREIAIMKKLDHPNVTKLVEVLDDPEDDNLYMVFELLKEGEVLVVPTDNPMSEKEAWLAFRDVVHGLEYLHYQKIIHRDLKPSNLLRADSGEVKIADLGVSNEFDGTDALLTNTAGTPAFTPPESISHKPGDEPYSGKTADIWSLGVTLFSLVYGKVPFHDDNIVALYNKIRTQELHLPNEPDISPELKCLITQMLVKDPVNRISLRDIMAHEWVTGYGLYPMASELENCRTLVEVTENEVQNSVHSVPKLDTLIMVKAMIKNHSFSNPFNPATTASSASTGSTASKTKSSPVERCDSAPGSYDMYNDARIIMDPSLPVLSEEEKSEVITSQIETVPPPTATAQTLKM